MPFAGLANTFDRQHASQVLGFAAVAIAAAALAGQWADLQLLLGWGAGLPVMTPFAAGCLAALGLALIRPGDPVLAILCWRSRQALLSQLLQRSIWRSPSPAAGCESVRIWPRRRST
jgi:hypothetical protein